MSSEKIRRVLILGGTGEASQIAGALLARTDLMIVSSLAGRVAEPRMPAGLVRVGGFGGVAGLGAYLRDERVDVVIDATHPFAARISRNAELACREFGVPLIAFRRAAWRAQLQDRWTAVADFASAALAVDREGNRVLLSIGRKELAAFSGCTKACFLVRAIERPDVPLPLFSKLILSRGPFSIEEERELLRAQAITHVVTKNSGGDATYAKIQAARELGIDVVMIERPEGDRAAFGSLDAVYQRLEELLVTERARV